MTHHPMSFAERLVRALCRGMSFVTAFALATSPPKVECIPADEVAVERVSEGGGTKKNPSSGNGPDRKEYNPQRRKKMLADHRRMA